MSSVQTHLGRTKTNNFSAIDIPVLEKYCLGKSVLDIGCANGDVVKYLISKGTEAYGIDGDTDAVNLYADDSVKQSLFCHDYTLGPSNFKKEIDVVLSTDFCEHIEEQFIDNYMPDFTLGDMVILHTPPKGTPGHHHVNTQDREYWILLFAQYGLILDEKLTADVREISDYYNPEDMDYFHKHPNILPKFNYLVFKKK
jgi:2-polyprenyl-3-methyl-5-hydroxy-6-metoxy-1,4-benzoquinol methylase